MTKEDTDIGQKPAQVKSNYLIILQQWQEEKGTTDKYHRQIKLVKDAESLRLYTWP